MPPILDQILVLDLSRLLPGAIASLMLADMGADIIKLEDTNLGDYARVMPPFHQDMGAFFQVSNRNKRSLSLDLKSDDGLSIFYRLIQKVDVLIESFRPGVMARLGCSYESLCTYKPDLIMASLSGWGQTGPYAELSGHDLNYVAENAVLGLTPTLHTPGTQSADVAGAYAAVSAINAALFQRERTGQGAYIDCSLAESAIPLALYGWVEAHFIPPHTAGALNGGLAYYHVYQSKDGQTLALAALEEKFWANFCQAIQQPDWLPLHQDLSAQADLKSKLEQLFLSRTAEAWQALLSPADCCFSVVTEPLALSEHPHFQNRDIIGVEQGLPWIHLAATLNPKIQHTPAPTQGQHSREILTDLGFTPLEIDQFIHAGTLKSSE